MTLRRAIWLSFLLCACAPVFGGCHHHPAHKRLATWTFHSTRAPYALTLPGRWKKESPKNLNAYADFAATDRGAFFLIVIPQQLPQIDSAAPPNALSLKQASLDLLREQIEDFKVDRQGPVKLGDTTGMTVFSRGKIGNQEVRYIATYATLGHWGFQIVAWAPLTKSQQLVAAVDDILQTWKFTTPQVRTASLKTHAPATKPAAKSP